MAITYVEYYKTLSTPAAGGDITSDSFSVATDDIITAMVCVEDNDNAGTLSISSTGGLLGSWTQIAVTATTGNIKAGAWWAKATGSGNITVTVLGSGSTNLYSALSCVVHTAADGTDPVPSGKIYSAVNGEDDTQSITPSDTGSCLWMVVGDWQARDALAAATNCTVESTHHVSARYTTSIIRPTTQPLTSSSAFTIGQGADASDETVAWVAFEVKAAGVTYQYARPNADTSDGAWLGQDGGANLYSYIDETSPSSADYIATPGASTCEGTFSAVTSYGAGAVLFNYVVGGDGAGTVKVTLLSSTSVVGQWTHASLATGPTSFSQTITGLLSGGTNLSWRFETT